MLSAVRRTGLSAVNTGCYRAKSGIVPISPYATKQQHGAAVAFAPRNHFKRKRATTKQCGAAVAVPTLLAPVSRSMRPYTSEKRTLTASMP